MAGAPGHPRCPVRRGCNRRHRRARACRISQRLTRTAVRGGKSRWGGRVDMGMDSLAPYVAWIQEKKLRGLAIAGAKRWRLLPDVPTTAESGLPGLEAAVWYALLAPTGTAPEIIAKLNEAGNAYL